MLRTRGLRLLWALRLGVLLSFPKRIARTLQSKQPMSSILRRGIFGVAAMIVAFLLAAAVFQFLIRHGIVIVSVTDPITLKGIFVGILALSALAVMSVTSITRRLVKGTRDDADRNDRLGSVRRAVSYQKHVHLSENSKCAGDEPLHIPPPPEGLRASSSNRDGRRVLHISGLGVNTGPALFFSVLGSICIFLGLLTIYKWLFRPDAGDIWINLGVWFVAALFWLLALWRGRFSTVIEMTDKLLCVGVSVPMMGRWRDCSIARSEIDCIRIEQEPRESMFAPSIYKLRIEEKNGASHTYLRNYPEEAIQWVADAIQMSLNR